MSATVSHLQLGLIFAGKAGSLPLAADHTAYKLVMKLAIFMLYSELIGGKGMLDFIKVDRWEIAD